MTLDYPLRFDSRGRTADTTHTEHVRDLIEQVLFTAPGERVMRPEFGSGLMQLLFSPVGDEMVAATQMLVQGALQQQLGALIDVEAVETRQVEGMFEVLVQYVVKADGERQVDRFSQAAP